MSQFRAWMGSHRQALAIGLALILLAASVLPVAYVVSTKPVWHEDYILARRVGETDTSLHFEVDIPGGTDAAAIYVGIADHESRAVEVQVTGPNGFAYTPFQVKTGECKHFDGRCLQPPSGAVGSGDNYIVLVEAAAGTYSIVVKGSDLRSRVIPNARLVWGNDGHQSKFIRGDGIAWYAGSARTWVEHGGFVMQEQRLVRAWTTSLVLLGACATTVWWLARIRARGQS